MTLSGIIRIAVALMLPALAFGQGGLTTNLRTYPTLAALHTVTCPVSPTVTMMAGVSADPSPSNDGAYQCLAGSWVQVAQGSSSGVTNPSGMSFHMDGVKYASINALLLTQPNGESLTIYDDCPGGTETLSYDPFHPSNGLTYHVHLISIPCLYVVNTPIFAKTGDTWDMTPGGYSANQVSTPVVAGTVLRMGPLFTAKVPDSAAPLGSSVTASFGGSGGSGWTIGDYYFIGLTATSAAGETPLRSGNNTSTSYSSGLLYASGQVLSVTIPTISSPVTGYCAYAVQNTANSFPTNVDPVGLGCFTSSGLQAVNVYDSSHNPPPGVNTTQAMLTLGEVSNWHAAIENRTYVRGGMIDCFAGDMGIVNNEGQDPPSGVFQMTFENCAGDAALLAEGFDGHLGANGSSVESIFLTPSNCEEVSGGCQGGTTNASTPVTSAAWPIYGIHDDAVPQLKSLKDVDVGADNCGDSSDSGSCPLVAGIRLDGAAYGKSATRVTVSNVHAEGLTTGCSGPSCVPAAVDVNGVPSQITGVHTSAQVNDSVRVRSGSKAVTVESVTPYTSKPGLLDDVNSFTSANGAFIGFYAIGDSAGNVLSVDKPIFGNQLQLGATSQTSPSQLSGFGGSSSDIGFTVEGSKSDGTNTTDLYWDPDAANVLSVEAPGHTGASTLANEVCTQGNGLCHFATFTKGATVTANNLQCVSSSLTVTDCGASPGNWLGVAITTATPVEVVYAGTVLVNADGASVVGDTVCAGTTAGEVTDSGGTTPCTLGSQVGVVISITAGGSSATLPLVLIARD